MVVCLIDSMYLYWLPMYVPVFVADVEHLAHGRSTQCASQLDALHPDSSNRRRLHSTSSLPAADHAR
jgi:hypothetical protein